MAIKRFPATGLLAIMEAKGYTRSRLAKAIGRSTSGIKNYSEKPEASPMPENDISMAAAALGVTEKAISPTWYSISKVKSPTKSAGLHDNTGRVYVYGLKSAREKCGFSGKTVQGLIKVSDSSYYEYENLRTPIETSKVHQLAKHLDTTYEDLTTNREFIVNAESVPENIKAAATLIYNWANSKQ